MDLACSLNFNLNSWSFKTQIILSTYIIEEKLHEKHILVYYLHMASVLVSDMLCRVCYLLDFCNILSFGFCGTKEYWFWFVSVL